MESGRRRKNERKKTPSCDCDDGQTNQLNRHFEFCHSIQTRLFMGNFK